MLPQGLTTRTVARPHYPLAINHLFAGNKGPNELLAELKEECYSADSIDLIVSFIKWSGYLKLKQALHSFTERGGKLRILTTTYVGNTDAKALLALSKLPNTIIKVCYDSKRVRLHAKSYIFRRQSGFGSAYVGSANLTSPALTSGVEWNVKIAQAQDAQVFEQICSAFEYFFASETFEEFTGTEAQMNRLEEALRLEKGGLKAQTEEADMSFFNLQPYYFQQQILDKLQAQRELNNSWRNLVVAATGTGKTVIAAFDFKRFYQHMLRTEKREARLLFIVPRIEIAKQALGTFRQVLRDQNFGDLLSGENHPASPAQLFAVIDSVNSRALPEHLPSDYYDYVVLDEVHHAAAMSYQRVLSHFKPKILLGLTATPERADGQEIFSYFDNRVSARIRLPEAIDRGLLCPFSYFGISDDLDLNYISRVGDDYNQQELEQELSVGQTANKRAELVFQKLCEYWVDGRTLQGLTALGFCVSVKHAQYMAKRFNELVQERLPALQQATQGQPIALCLSGQSSREERAQAQRRLVSGELKIIFTADLYNEGVDIPEVNTVLFLRPTNSLTIFLQQLGRGLRLSEHKNELLVLDFIAPDKRNFSYALRYQALLRNPTVSIKESILSGFDELPAGCFIELEKVAQETVLNSLSAGENNLTNLSKKLRLLYQTGTPVSLREFLERFCLQLSDLYKGKNTFYLLKQKAGLVATTPLAAPEDVTHLIQNLSKVEAPSLLNFVLQLLQYAGSWHNRSWSELEQKYINMLKASAFPNSKVENITNARLFALLEQRPVQEEIKELCAYILDESDILTKALAVEQNLEVYGQYTRNQLLTALDTVYVGNNKSLIFVKERGINVLLVTLDKNKEDFKQEAGYDDYSIDSHTFHWQSSRRFSQSDKVMQDLADTTNKILLFVRQRKNYGNSGNNLMPYACLGEATVLNYTGEKPVNFTLHLKNEIPAKFLRQTQLYSVNA